jgi:hypothetical protein
VVADAGMISEAYQVAIKAAGLSFILGTRIPFLPDVVREWRATPPRRGNPRRAGAIQPWPVSPSGLFISAERS